MEFITVMKDGIEDEFLKSVWDKIGGDKNKYGWVRIASTPVEVEVLKQKKNIELTPIKEDSEEPVVKELKSKKANDNKK